MTTRDYLALLLFLLVLFLLCAGVKRMGIKEAHRLSNPREHWRFEGALDAVSK